MTADSVGKDLSPAPQILQMRWFKRDKEKDRFYLLAGMGGRALRRKHRLFLGWSIVFGVVVSAIVACLLYLMSRR
jgi:hypothetical protein